MEEEFQDGLEKAPLFEESASQQENLQKISEYVAPIGERGYSTLIDGQGGRKELEVPAGTMVTADGLITLPDGIVINQKGEIYKTDGSIWDLYGNVIRPETPVIEIAETSGENNKVKAVLLKECAGAIGYHFVISENPNCIVDKDYYQIDKNRLEPEGEFTYVQKGSYYVYCHAWTKNSQGKSVQQMVQWKRGGGNCPDSGTAPDSKSICEKNKVTVTYTKTADTEGYDLVFGKALEKVNGELRPVDYGKYVKRLGEG